MPIVKKTKRRFISLSPFFYRGIKRINGKLEERIAKGDVLSWFTSHGFYGMNRSSGSGHPTHPPSHPNRIRTVA